MTDYFATFSIPRRPWLDQEPLRLIYLSLSNQSHLDRMHLGSSSEQQAAVDQASEINAAYQCLRDHKERLRHFLELERGRPPQEIQTISSSLAEAMLQVGRLCQEADAVTRQRANESAALLKAMIFSRAQALHEQMAEMLRTLAAWQTHLEQELRRIDGEWAAGAAGGSEPILLYLEDLFRQFSYSKKWRSQLEEKSFQLLL